MYATPIARLIEEFAKMPGIGKRTAERLSGPHEHPCYGYSEDVGRISCNHGQGMLFLPRHRQLFRSSRSQNPEYALPRRYHHPHRCSGLSGDGFADSDTAAHPF